MKLIAKIVFDQNKLWFYSTTYTYTRLRLIYDSTSKWQERKKSRVVINRHFINFNVDWQYNDNYQFVLTKFNESLCVVYDQSVYKILQLIVFDVI